MAYPFKREPEISESDFSINQHKAIEEIMYFERKNKIEESLKLSLEWIDNSNAYSNLNVERSSLEGLSKLYYLVACDLKILGRHEESLQFYENSNDTMEKCCAISFSLIYLQILASGYFLYAIQLKKTGQDKKALSEAQKSLQLTDILIEQPGNECNIVLKDNKEVIEEFINELLS